MSSEAIMAAAWRLYAEEGLTAVTLERVAEAVGVDVAQVEESFPTAQALTREMYVASHIEHTGIVDRAVSEAKTGVEALDRLLHSFVHFYLERPELFRFGFGTAMTDTKRIGADLTLLRDRVLHTGPGLLDATEELLSRDWGDSELPHGMHPRRLAFVTLLTAIGFLNVRDIMASMGTTLRHSDEQVLNEIRRTVASGPNVLRHLGALNAVSRELARLRSEEEVFACAPRLLRSALELEQVALLVPREGTMRLVSSDPALTDPGAEEAIRGLEGYAEDRTVYVAGQTPPSRADWAPPLVFTPVRHDGEVAALLVGKVGDRELDRRDVSRVEMFAVTTGLALENVRLYESLRGLVDQRTHQLRQAQDLVAGIAHELNTPVGAMHSAQDSLGKAIDKLEKRLSERYDDFAEDKRTAKTLDLIRSLGTTVGTASGRVEETVTRLRSFVRLDQADRQRVDLHRCIDDALQLLAHRLPERIEVVRQFSELPEIECAPAELNQLFFNVIDNAVHAIEGAGTITIATELAGDLLRVVIADTGIGIPEADLDRVFDAGFTTRGVGVGTGLGLSMCHQIARQHGGDIAVSSTPGRGTTVTVKLARG